MDGNRVAVAGVVTVAVLLGLLVILGAYGPAVVAPNSPTNFLFSALVTGDLTLLTVVLSINQLVLSRELGEPGTFRQRIDETIDYRRQAESTVDAAVSPTSPSSFLQFLHEALGEEASALEDEATDVDGDLGERLRSLVDSLEADVRLVDDTVERAGDHVFTVVSATLSTNHADQLREITALRHRHADALPPAVTESLSTIEDLLLDIDVARQYFKTVFVQKELAYLSRVLLTVSVPAIVGCGLTLALYNAAHGVAVPTAVRGVVFTVTFTAGFAPLAVLFAFALRLAWVAQQSSTTAPFGSTSTYQP